MDVLGSQFEVEHFCFWIVEMFYLVGEADLEADLAFEGLA